jgi:hypothetical protein
MESFCKQPSEKYQIEIDFTNVITSIETISSISVKGYLANTEDNTIIDTSSFADSSVYITVKSGTNNMTYKITAKVTTDLGNIYEHDIQMIVEEI